MKVDIFNTDRKYDIIYADPPWEYKQTGGTKNARGTAKSHYKTMTTDSICRMAPTIQKIKTNTSICFMWATFPNIGAAIEVLESWGFTYKTAAFIWIKQNKKSDSLFWGMGAYTRANAEVLLIGISKGTKAKTQVIKNNVHQVVFHKVLKHSEKPNIFREKIIELLGYMSRIELFARENVEGWDCWGSEV